MSYSSFPFRSLLAGLLFMAGSASAPAAALFGCTDGLFTLTNHRYALNQAPPDVFVTTDCKPLISGHSSSAGPGSFSASAAVHTIAANGVQTQALATTVNSLASAYSSGTARLVFRVLSDTLPSGTTVPLGYSLELLTLGSETQATGTGSVTLSGRGFFTLGSYNPATDTWSSVGPTGGPSLVLNAFLGAGATSNVTDQPLYVQIGRWHYLDLTADVSVGLNALGGSTTSSAAGLMAVLFTGSLNVPAGLEIEWLASQALGLPVPQLGDIGIIPVPLPGSALLLASGLLVIWRAGHIRHLTRR